jgi:uncharacterized protein with NRDE domain
MCLLLIAKNIHPEYKLIIAANRDEFYNRPAEPAAFWNEFPSLLAGKDLTGKGTWLGITKDGRFSALTNFRNLKNTNPNAPSRGRLTLDFLTSEDSPGPYYEKIKKSASLYNGFNLITGIGTDLYYFSNVSSEFKEIGDGIVGLSNDLLDTPWPKVTKIKEVFLDKMKDIKNPGPLLDALSDNSPFEDELLPDTGVGIDLERTLSPMFVKTSVYGTRCSTVILVSVDNNVSFAERTYETNYISHKEYNFRIGD